MASNNQENTVGSAGSNALAESIGRPRTILEIGAHVGAPSALARRRGSVAVGLETVESALAGARAALDEAFYVDAKLLESPKAFDAVKGRKFDMVVLGSVLDDVRKPEELLLNLRPHLVDGGHVLVSVSGDVGAASRLLESSGFEVLRVDASPRALVATTEKLGWNGDPTRGTPDEPLKTTAGGVKPSHIVRPLERLIGQIAPPALEIDRVIVARIPPKAGKLSLTIGMLTLNEEKSVEQMIDDIRAVAPDANIVLIDSSSDKTPDLARAKGARVVRQLPPRGHGPAMERLMYEAAKDTEALIYLDCDFTYPTSMIPKIRALLESGVDLVNASRTAKYPKAMPVPNFLANRFFAATAQVVHGVPTTDVHSGMRGYRLSMVRAFDFDGEGDAIPLDTLILPARSGYDVVEFPIPYAERVGDSKLAKFRGTAWTFIRIAGAVGHGKRVRSGGHYRVQSG